jgi:hypothetical protein
MKYALIVVILCSLVAVLPVSACENDREINGYFWSFNRMDDGNSYHECQLSKAYSEGSSLVLNAPCDMRFIDSVQIDWSDNRARLQGTLITYPNMIKHKKADISGKSRHTWAVNREVDKLELAFSGQHGKRCNIKWIRIFYGKNRSSGNSGFQRQSVSGDIQSLTTPDKIKFGKGPAERPCRVMSWDGNELTVVVKRGNNKNIERKLGPSQIDYILFDQRWGKATGKNGITVPFKAKRFKNGKLWFDKKEGKRVISKELYPIEKFSRIDFNK